MKSKLNNFSTSEIILFSTVLFSFLFKLMDWLIFNMKNPSSDINIYLCSSLPFLFLSLSGMIVGAMAVFKEKEIRRRERLKLGVVLNLLMFVIIIIL